MKKRILCFCLCLYCIGLWAANASFKKTGNDLLFLLPQGNVKLEFCTDDMFRVRHSQGTVFAENEQWMVRKYDFTPVHYTVEDKGAAWLITTGKLIIEATKNPFCLSVSDKNGKLLYTELAEQRFYKDSVKTKAVLQPDEHFFGFGERMDFMDQRGRKVYECRVGKRDKTGCRRKRYFTCQLLSRTFYDEYQRIWFVLSYSVCYRMEYGVG